VAARLGSEYTTSVLLKTSWYGSTFRVLRYFSTLAGRGVIGDWMVAFLVKYNRNSSILALLCKD
jgi:hypothetical protein